MNAPESDAQRPTFVGRRPELERLAGFWRAASGGNGRVAVIGGEAGIGKSALVREFMERVAADGGRIHVGQSYDRTPIALHDPWSEILGSIRAARGQEDRRWQAPEPEDDASRINALVSEILPLADEPPSLIVLEDAQWADAASVEILLHVMHRCARQRFLTVVTIRADDQLVAAPIYLRLPEIVREVHVARLELAPLTPEETRALVDDLPALSPADASALTTFLVQHSDGIPLFIAEMIETLRRNGMLRRSAMGWELEALPSVSESVPIPELLRQIVEARLQHVGAGIRQNLQLIAVVGRSVPVDRWPALFEQTEADLIETIEAGLRSGVLVEAERDGHPEFRHALFRQTLLAEISTLRRRSLHRQVAEFLCATPEPRPHVVAAHFEQAGDARAIPWLTRAADAAERSFSMMTAVEYLEGVLRMLAVHGDYLPLRERGWLLLRVGSLHRQTLLPPTRDYVGEALAIALEVGDRALEIQALWADGMNTCLRGRNGLEKLEAALAIAATLHQDERDRAGHELLTGMPADLTVARGSLVILCAVFGALERARGYANEYRAIPVGDERRDRTILGQVHMGLAFACEAAGATATARRELRAALAIYRDLDFTWRQAVIAQDLLLNVLAFAADDREARARTAAEVERLWQVTERGVTRLPPRFGLLPLLALYGEWSEVRRLAEPFLEQAYIVQTLVYPVLAGIARCQDRGADARRIIAALFPEGPDTPARSAIMSYALPTLFTALDLALDEEDLALAGRWIAAAERWLGRPGDPEAYVVGRSQLAAKRGRLALLEDDSERALAEATAAVAAGRSPYQPLALVEGLLLLGECRRGCGQPEAARAAWQEALALAANCEAAYWIADAELRLARLEAGLGDGEAARERSTRALATIDRLDARLLLRGLGPTKAEQPASTDLPDGVRITPRELEIARLLVTGKSNREMAEQLSISVRTVERHISNLYEKTGASGRAAITAYVLSNNLV